MSLLRRPVLALSVAVSVLILLALGTWQVARLQWKLDLIARIETRTEAAPVPLASLGAPGTLTGDQEYTPVRLEGHYLPDRQAHIFGTFDGAAGWFVFQPFQVLTADGRDLQGVILVNRGFLPVEARGEVDYAAPAGPVSITGLLRQYASEGGLAGALAPPADPEAGSFYIRAAAPISAYLLGPLDPADRAQLYSLYIDRSGPGEAPLVGDTTRLEFHNRHLGYALTWYGLAAGLIAVYVVMMRRPADRR